jgi:hypothetical protein
MVEEPTSLPPEFILLLRPNSAVGRRCQIIWRVNNKVGVRFVSASAFDLDKHAHRGSGVWAPK